MVRSAKPYRGDERSFWDNAPVESRHKGYVPVPGFGEYYTPPAPPPEPEEDDDEEEGDDRWTAPSRIRQQPPEEGRRGLNESQAAKGAYVPVPGFGEYYAPPAPGKTKGKAKAGKEERDEDDSQDHAWASKVRSQPAEAGRWQPGDTAPYVPTPEPQARQSREWFGFGGGGGGGSDPAEDYYARDDQSWSEQQSFADEEPLPSAFAGAASNFSDYGDDELRRLRVIYGMFRKTVAALRYIVPFTGGLACWIAAAQTLTAWWTMASMVPFLTGLLTFSMFGFLVTLGAAFFSGMYMAVTVFTRTLRYMLDGRMTEAWPARDQAQPPPMQITAQRSRRWPKTENRKPGDG